MSSESVNSVVSVLISVYNQIHCLEKALNSALEQTYPNLEIIIGDDCSSDADVGAYLEKYNDSRIKYIRNPINLGANGNYKKMLFEGASGEFAVVLNADDYWTDKNFISSAISIFQKNKGVSLVFGNIETYIVSEKKFIKDSMHEGLPEIMLGNEYFLNYTKGYSLPHLTCLYKREKAIDLNFYDNVVLSTDWEYLLKICIDSNIAIIHHPVGVLTKHNNNYSKESDLQRLREADCYVLNLYDFALEKKVAQKHVLDEWKRKMLIRHHSKSLVKLYFLDEDNIQEYRKFLKEAYPDIYSSLVYSFRYLAFVGIRRVPFLLKFVFRTFFKQESFIVDLIAYKKMRNK